jgi:hypothetical protein
MAASSRLTGISSKNGTSSQMHSGSVMMRWATTSSAKLRPLFDGAPISTERTNRGRTNSTPGAIRASSMTNPMLATFRRTMT